MSDSVAVLLVHTLSTILQLQTDDVGFDEGGGGGGGDECADGGGNVLRFVAASSIICPSAGHRWSSLW